MTNKRFLFPVLIAAVGALFFLPFLGAVHLFDWDEINFAESAREMIASGNYAQVQINYQPFWEKPPLFFWMQALSMHLFDINEFAARLPNAITGILTLLTFYFIGKKYYGQRFGFLWAMCMIGSFLPHLYFKSGIIDPVFNYFIFLGIFCLILTVHSDQKPGAIKYAAWSGFFIGLAILTKGPVALLLLLLCVLVYWVSIRFRAFLRIQYVLAFLLTCLLTAGTWFALDVWVNGIGFVGLFIKYQLALFTQSVAGHGEPFYYHFIVVLVGCFPMSILALPSLIKMRKLRDHTGLQKWMLILFWVVLILFSIVKTKIVHYSSLTYFPLSFLAAKTIEAAIRRKKALPIWTLILVGIFGSLFAFLLSAVPWLGTHADVLTPYLHDPFAVDCLQSPVSWNGTEVFIGIGYWVAIMLAIILLWKKRVTFGASLLFGATAVCLLVYLKAVVPKIEGYSQAPAIRFYKELSGQNVYVTPVGFKSYAQYFYFQKPPGDNPQQHTQEWLLTATLDRPAYFVLKTTDKTRMQQYGDVSFLYQEGGFAFFKRNASKEDQPLQ